MNHYYELLILIVFVLIGLFSFKLFRQKKVNKISESVRKAFEDLKQQSKTPIPITERIFASNCKRKVVKNQKQYRKYVRSNPNQNRFR